VGHDAARIQEASLRWQLAQGEMELTVDDPAYMKQLADNRKFEIREWLTRRLANLQISKADHDKKLQMVEDADFNGDL